MMHHPWFEGDLPYQHDARLHVAYEDWHTNL